MFTGECGPDWGNISFSLERPTEEDLRLWQEVVRDVTFPTLCYSPPLGVYVSEPMESVLWLSLSTGDCIYRKQKQRDGSHSYHKYVKDTTLHQTHGTCRYCLVSQISAISESSTNKIHVLSVSEGNKGSVSIHSQVLWDRTWAKQTKKTFHDYLSEIGDADLWCNLTYNDNGLWLRHSLEWGFLVIAHGGSYMSDQSTRVCAAGGVITCLASNRWPFLIARTQRNRLQIIIEGNF